MPPYREQLLVAVRCKVPSTDNVLIIISGMQIHRSAWWKPRKTETFVMLVPKLCGIYELAEMTISRIELVMCITHLYPKLTMRTEGKICPCKCMDVSQCHIPMWAVMYKWAPQVSCCACRIAWDHLQCEMLQRLHHGQQTLCKYWDRKNT